MSLPEHVQNRPSPDRRWAGLVFICLAQLMIVLDITIVNIALPSAQWDLGISDGDRQWVITGYTLAFGSLLLLGGRLADRTGRKRAFVIGLLGFAAASALGGAATGFPMLLAARALQGAFAALLAPAALSLLTISFTAPRERARAFGVFGAIAAGGGAVGLVLGGLLTEYLDWRWCLYVNVPIALVAALGWYVLPRDVRERDAHRLDVLGALLAVGGLVLVVYGCSRAESQGWTSQGVLALLFAGVVALVAFVLVERRAAHPLLPLRVVTDRTRGAAYLAVGMAIVGMFAMFLFLTYYMQAVQGYSALRAGFAFLPQIAGVLLAAGGVASRMLPRVAPRVLVVPGLLLAAGGTAWLTRLEANSSYVAGVLPAELAVGFGMGLVMATAMNYATRAVRPADAGVASATVNTAQQIGGSVGTALLNTVATAATADALVGRRPTAVVRQEALVEGFSAAYGVVTFVLLGAALVVGLLMNARRPQPSDEPEPAAESALPAG